MSANGSGVLGTTASGRRSSTTIPAALGKLSRASLPKRISLRYLSPIQVIESVLSRTVDLGITGDLPRDHRGVDLQWLGEAGCVAVLPVHSPLACLPVLTMKALVAQPLITLLNHFRVGKRITHAFSQEDISPSGTLFETNSSLSAMQMARAGLGLAVVDPLSAQGIPLEGATVRPLEILWPGDAPWLAVDSDHRATDQRAA